MPTTQRCLAFSGSNTASLRAGLRRGALTFLLFLFAMGARAIAGEGTAPTTTLRLVTQNNYLPGIPVLVRVEALGPDGGRDRDTWDSQATLASDNPSVTLSTNRVFLRNGLGSALVTFTGGGDFNLTASIGTIAASRSLVTAAALPVTKIGGTLSGTSTVWSNVVQVTNALTVPSGHTLTILSNTLVLINGVASGSSGPGITVVGKVQSFGTEDKPVTFTCGTAGLHWGEIRHTNATLAASALSTYRNTIFTAAGRSPAIGHTSTGPAFRMFNSSNLFDGCTISDNAGKVMYATGCDLVFTNCQIARSIMGPEITATAIKCVSTWLTEMHGTPTAPEGTNDNDGIYLWGQQAGQTISLSDCVIADAQDDGIDTLGSTVTVTNCIIRDCNNVNEDAKGISGFDSTIDVRRCLVINCLVGLSMKTSAGTAGRFNIQNSTVTGIQRAIAAAVKANAPGPIIDFRVTNSILNSVDAVYTDFGPTNFSIGYCVISESWPGTGNIVADPLFVGSATNNYRLRPGSPCINAGSPASPPDADGSAADIGFYPFLSNADPLIAAGSNWRYLDKGTDAGTAWRARLFDDSSWSNGLAQLGYGEGDEITTNSFGPDPQNKYTTTYYRRSFTVLNPSELSSVEALLLVDDGAVVYVNGQEAFRANMDASPVTFATFATTNGENTLFTNYFSPSLLVPGTNVVAVEVHQGAPTSTDLSFDFQLRGVRSIGGNSAPLATVTSPANGTTLTTPANVSVTASGSDADGSVTNLAVYQNGQLLSQVGGAALSFAWNNVPVGTYTLVAVATDDKGARGTSSPVSLTVTVPSTTTTNTLVAAGSIWRYLDKGTDPGSLWSDRTFADTGWSNGVAPLGYCTSACSYNIATSVNFGPDALNKYITTYFRRNFVLDDPSRVQLLRLTLLRDDGAVAYINGVEMFRTNMPEGAISYLTLASLASNYTPDQTFLPTNAFAALVAGTNVLAIEIHQGNGSSSDIVLEAQLDAVMAAITNQKPVVNITAPANNSTYASPLTTTITANAVDLDGTITNVAFYVNGVKLLDDTAAPYAAAWNNVPAGNYNLAAVATDATGLSATSAVVVVTVSTNTAAPVIFTKTPAPGNVTNLTQVTVTFSKAVQGIDAADLLINGIPAANVTGSGSNYTFSFAQPAYGTVLVRWASTHGITDVFTPPAAFNTNSTGANWNYQLLDVVPPTILALDPIPGVTVAALNQIAVTFSEPVTGVNAGDLLINTVPATNVSGTGAGPYSFRFAQPGQGTVAVGWAAGHGIQDLSTNSFAATPWSYTLDTNSSGVVISEIMYHPSSENVREEYIELFNKGGTAVDLNGWRLSSGVDFTFSNVQIAAGAYLVVAADVAVFAGKYPGVTNVVGGWTGVLNNDGEDIDLDDARGRRADSVHYADEGDWATRQRGAPETVNGFTHRGWAWFKPHDGGGRSLELINPLLSNNNGQNWGPSAVTNGTPGRMNSIFQNNIAPLILEPTHFPIIPRSTDPIVVSARIVDEAAGGLSVTLFYRVDSANPPAFTSAAMHDDGLNGDLLANDGLFSARIPASANNAVIEYYISVSDAQSHARTWPAPAIASPDGVGPTGQVVNALFQVDDVQYASTNSQPLYKLIMTENERAELAIIPSHSDLQGPNAQMNGTFISIDGSGAEHHYNVGIRNRGHGSRLASPPNYHVNFRSDDSWKGLVGLNLNSVQVHIQHFGSVISRKSGAVGGSTYAAQVRVNNVNRAVSGSPMFGSYAAVEVIDQDFADYHFPTDNGGNLYRVIRDLSPPDFSYRGENKNAYTNTWYKLNNASENDWTDLIGMLRVMGVNNTTAFTTANVRQVVNVEQWMRHLAVMNLLGNSESGLNSGFNDDYCLYRGVNDSRFDLIFWDLDQILGEGGAFSPNSDIFSMTANNGSGLAFDRFMHWPEFEPMYYRTLQDLLNTTFAKTNFDSLMSETLGGYVPASTMNAMIAWMDARRSYVQGVIPALSNQAASIANVTGTPRSPTPMTSATFTVGGAGVISYQFRLNGGAWSAELPIATLIQLSSLANGTNVLAVIGKGTNGVWQATSNATTRVWLVNTAIPPVRLNEVLARNAAALNHNNTFPDAVELFNEGPSAVDLGGLRLTDDQGNPNKFTFPAGTVINSGSYLVLYANNADGTPGFHLGFSIDADGDDLYLFASTANGGALLDSVRFGRQLSDLSLGRLGNSGEWRLTQPTFGNANILQPLGDPRSLRINEWLAASQSQPDFVELYNSASLPVDLGGLFMTDSPIGNPARNEFDPLHFMGPGEWLALTADGNGNGRAHLNFSLALEQGELGLLSADRSIIDSIIYGPQQPDVAQGRCPDGGLNYVTLGIATPGAPNSCPISLPAAQTNTLVSITNTWRYEVSGADPGSTWTTLSYNDSAWLTGAALLFAPPARAYSLPEPVNTILPYPTNIVTYYFRTKFTVPATATISALQFSHVVDDGAVFYLNGNEIGRFNLAAGTVTPTTLASSVTDAAYVGPNAVTLSNLVTGTNVLAVELHQNNASSADVTFGMNLVALVATNSPAAAGVLINEVLANNASIVEPDGSQPDWVELYNPSTLAVDVGGMSLTDATATPQRWVFPSGTILAGHAFLKVRLDAGSPSSSTNTGFGLKANGGSVFLFNRPADGGSLASSVAYGLQAADFSIGRIPDGSTNWVLIQPTLGSANLSAALGNAALLRINEWMADPASGEDYFELYNPNPQPVDISRFYLTDDLSNRTKHRLPALSFMGVGQDAFQRFDADDNTVAGADHVNFKLGATGEALALANATGASIDAVTFGPQAKGVSQGRLPDGSASIVNFPTTPTPGKSNFLPLDNLVINEVLTHTDPPLEDAVEFFNPSGDDVDISGWYLSDSQNYLMKYRVPTNTIVRAGGYAVLYEYQFNSDQAAQPFSFSSAKGDEVYLSQSTGAGTLTGYRAYATFGAAFNGVSFGRFRTTAGVDFTAMSARTFGVDQPTSTNQFRLGAGATNSYPVVGPVVINEMMYHPAISNDALEFIELRNITAAPVPLFDPANPANTWRLRKGIDFNFPPGVTIPAGGYLVVVSFDPLTDPISLAAFTSAYGTNMTLAGPFSGKLDNAGEAIELQRHDEPIDVPGPDFGFVPHVVADFVSYTDTAPWPVSPDGTGDSLKRINSSLYGNEPLNWSGGGATPGAANFISATNRPPSLGPIANHSVHAGYTVAFTITATDPDLPGQTLRFTLEGAPAGASVDPVTGAFTWMPAPQLVPGLYPMTVRVTDNGTPALNASTNFSIAVLSLPHVSSVQISGGSLQIGWESYAGRKYRLETATDLAHPVWTQVGADIIAAGATSSVTILAGTDPLRFYRISSFDN